MGGAYAMGAPWLRFAGRCNPALGRELSDWLAKMTGARGPGGPQAFGQWGSSAGPGFGSRGFGGPGFGPWWGAGRTWRTPKARRGDIRAAILAVLAEQPMNGYQIIQEIATRSGGVWKPSPGSIYPTLQQLEDEGLVERTVIPAEFNFMTIKGLKRESAEKLDRIRPRTVGQAGRISGVNPADIAILMVALERNARRPLTRSG